MLSCRGRYARTERGRGHQKVPGQFHSARSVLMSLGSQPALTCTDSYCAQPTPYQEPSGPSGRRTRLSRARLGKATGVPRGADDPQGPNRPGAGGFARRPPGRSSGGRPFRVPSSGHPHRAPMPGSAFPRRCMRSVLRRPSRRCRPGRRLVVQRRPKGSPYVPSRSPPVIVASAGRSGGDLASA